MHMKQCWVLNRQPNSSKIISLSLNCTYLYAVSELSQKYLYVIYPLDKGYDDEPTALRARPSTSEKHIAQLIRRSQDQVTSDIRDAMNQANRTTESRINEILQKLDELKE